MVYDHLDFVRWVDGDGMNCARPQRARPSALWTGDTGSSGSRFVNGFVHGGLLTPRLRAAYR
jgi:hypothetical protein